MKRVALLTVIALNLGFALGVKSIYDVYPKLREFTADNAFTYQWRATDQWRCPAFRDSRLTTKLGVIKAGKCSHVAMVDETSGPALDCCDLRGPTCSYEHSLSFTTTRSTTHGWKASMQAKFGDSKATGEWTFTAEYSGSITESAANTTGINMGWNDLDPGYIYVPRISYLQVRCTGIVYEDDPTIFAPAFGGYLYVEGHKTGYDKNTEMEYMSVPFNQDKTCGIKQAGKYWGKYEKTMNYPGIVALQLESNGKSDNFKMNDKYLGLWKHGSIDFPVLDSQGYILSVYGLDKIDCTDAARYIRTEDGYLERRPALFADPADLDEVNEDRALHEEL
ncbi:hypothetical protein CNMCM7691_005098 [Aspergillus felis]|uniref:Uncharacterized protein n=1 Tax=Aspergillus felis TaxID=1287682 RepID=A0A8H6R485_9EURO|nr:hypothetical protein CNMCM7691_005098 [Aspergillus felis]